MIFHNLRDTENNIATIYVTATIFYICYSV